MLVTILNIVFIIIFAYLAINVIYLFVVAVAGRFYSPNKYSVNPVKKKIAILMPSYKEDHIVVNSARKAREHDYPQDRFDVFVAADQLKPETIQQLREIPVNVKEVKFELSSKARSLNALLNSIPESEYEIAIILDSDNIIMPGCLEQVNDAFQKGYRAVQTHRTAKNNNSTVAILDGMSEEINNHLFRRGQRALGFSSNTIGSGMAFEFKKLKEIYNKPGILGNPACDREVDFEIMKADINIEFIEDAWVLDEKVANKAVYERQRTRWQESQIIHLRLFFDKKQGTIPKTKEYWNKLFTNLIPSRLLFLFSFFVVFVLFLVQYLIKQSFIAPSFWYWFSLFVIYLSVFFISIPGKFYSTKTLKAVLHIPVLMFLMVRGTLKMKVSRKEFLHTPKSFTQES